VTAAPDDRRAARGQLAYDTFNRCFAAEERMPSFGDLSVHEQRAWIVVAATVRRAK
jgi:hypothetical protein